MRFAFIFAVFIGLAACKHYGYQSGDAYTQSYETNEKTCRTFRANLERRIDACSAILSSNRLPPVLYAKIYGRRGNLYFVQRKYERAIRDYDRVVSLKPDHAIAYNNRGFAYERLEKYDRAIRDYGKAIALRSDYASPYNNRGKSYYIIGEYERAVRDYDQAIVIKPDNAKAYHNRGLAYFKKWQYDKAISDFDQAIALKPDYHKAFGNRGLAHIGKSQYGRALRDFDKALAIKPNSAGHTNNKAWLLATAPDEGIRDGAEAVRLAKRAFDRRNIAKHRSTLAAAYAETGRFDDAVETQEAAIVQFRAEGNDKDLPQIMREKGKVRDLAGYKFRLKLYRGGQAYRLK